MRRLFTILLMSLLCLGCFGSALKGQCPTNCPTYTQIPGDKGMSNDANIQILLGASSQGTLGNSDQVQDAKDAIDGWVAIPGNDQDYSVNTTAQSFTLSSAMQYVNQHGTGAAPIAIAFIGTGQDVSNMGQACAGAIACTQPIVDSTGTAKGSVTIIQAYTANNDTNLSDTLSHEFGVHSDMGWNDCTGANCGNQTDAGQGRFAGTGPTQCDTCQAQACGR